MKSRRDDAVQRGNGRRIAGEGKQRLASRDVFVSNNEVPASLGSPTPLRREERTMKHHHYNNDLDTDYYMEQTFIQCGFS